MKHTKGELSFIYKCLLCPIIKDALLLSPWVKGTRQLLMAAETIPQGVVKVDG